MPRLVIDTDLGDDIDDAYALALALKSPEIELEAILTNNCYERERAKIADKICKCIEKDVLILEGIHGGRGKLSQAEFIKDYGWNARQLEEKLNLIKEIFKTRINYLSIGSLTNLAYLLEKVPLNKANLFIMGGSLMKDYNGRNRKIAEWNIASDIKASRKLFSSTGKIVLVPLDSTWNLKLSKNEIDRINRSKSLLNQALAELYKLWKRFRKRDPILHDPFALSLIIDRSLAKFKEMKISINSEGKLIKGRGKDCKVAVAANRKKFKKFFTERLLT